MTAVTQRKSGKAQGAANIWYKVGDSAADQLRFRSVMSLYTMYKSSSITNYNKRGGNVLRLTLDVGSDAGEGKQGVIGLDKESERI